MAQILLEFFFCNEGLIVILGKFEILHKQLFFKSDSSDLRVWGVCPSFLMM
jgi:hypothetical protein